MVLVCYIYGFIILFKRLYNEILVCKISGALSDFDFLLVGS